MKLYRTAAAEGSAEYVVEKSRFIAYVKPVSSREEAESFIAAIRKKHRDATHNVPAMVIGDKMQIQWASDDGEPQGTSGAPMVRMMVGEGITDTVIVVTRYFGGIKLGTGGLTRAYMAAAKLGLAAAGICRAEERLCLTCRLDYTFWPKLQNAAGGLFEIEETAYTDAVEPVLCCEPENGDRVKELLSSITGGKGVIKEEKMKIVKLAETGAESEG